MEFFEEYMKFVGESEAPRIYHRWSCLSMIAAIAGRKAFFPFGHSVIHPNMYTVLVGAPGARKSTALNIAKMILDEVGYKNFACKRSSLERFVHDMQRPVSEEYKDLQQLEEEEAAACETFICNGEFLDFIGRGNMDFLTLLTNLWDNLPFYEHKKLHGSSVYVHKPTVNILGAATMKGLGMMMPAEAMGTGVFSRLMLVHSDPSDTKITFPEEVPKEAIIPIADKLRKVRDTLCSKMTMSKEAMFLTDRMYKEFPGMTDPKFVDYAARRLTMLMKVQMLIAISEGRSCIEREDTMIANTLLSVVERRMDRALGEFGDTASQGAMALVLEVLENASKPMNPLEIWKFVYSHFNSTAYLQQALNNLRLAEKIQLIGTPTGGGFMPLHKDTKEWSQDLYLENYLTAEEA